MRTCASLEGGTVELYFYDELTPPERAAFVDHLAACTVCRDALQELTVIRAALASNADVSAPPGGDWTSLMRRIDSGVRRGLPEPSEQGAVVIPFTAGPAPVRTRWVAFAAIAAALTVATVGSVVLTRIQSRSSGRPAVVAGTSTAPVGGGGSQGVRKDGFEASSEQHLERSKLVVLGLATKDPSAAQAADWIYERQLAGSLLNDTRMFRLAAEDRGMAMMAGVMRDLELVLLETSLTADTDRAALEQIQRLIRKRDLLGKMNVITTSGI